MDVADERRNYIGHTLIGGVDFHVYLIEVTHTTDGVQSAVQDPYGRLEDVYELGGADKPLHIVGPPEFDGREFVMVVHPYC